MNERKTIRVATRGSLLALAQTRWVVERLQAARPDLAFDIVTFRTSGDRLQEAILSEVGGKGLFTKELEEALLQGGADLAVHSLKDMPSQQPEGLVIAAYPEREDPRDVLYSRDGRPLDALPEGALVGTSSLRRQLQMQERRPDLRFAPIRGNIDTRMRKVSEGRYDATVLALAGLKRLGMAERATQVFSAAEMLPAPGQGVLALECRADDAFMLELCALVHHEPTATAARAERAFLARLEGDCRLPAAALATLTVARLELAALADSLDGRRVVRARLLGDAGAPVALGRAVAERILKGRARPGAAGS